MLKFIRGKGQQPSAERQKLQRDLFAFRKTVQHGFPHKPSAMAWDPLLRLLALGTCSGALRLLGKPGVEYSGHHTSPDTAVTHLHFIPGTGKLLSVLSDNSLHLWEAGDGGLICTRSVALEGKLKLVWSVCAETSGKRALLGTEGGNIYLLNLDTFSMAEDIIYQDVVMQNCPEDYKLNPGAVECMSEHPHRPELLLIGYARGLLVVWDREAARATNTFQCSQQLESVCWHENGKEFTSSHNDGSYVTWELALGERPLRDPVTLYGPFPCKPITKLLQRTSVDTGENITIFAGGMPRSSYSDKYTVTVVQGDKHVCFDFTSRVIDFVTTTSLPPEDHDEDFPSERPTTASAVQHSGLQQPAAALLVLLEEELVALDLTQASWGMLRPPYLVSLHASALTCTHLVSNVTQEVYNNILQAGLAQTKQLYTDSPWPVTGGSLLCAKPADPEEFAQQQLLITGHEDGSVAFWDARGVTLTPLLKVSTANLFSGEDGLEDAGGAESPAADEEDGEEEWPPFRKAGVFDPYSDDPRLAVKKLALCPLTGTLLVAGTAGHVITATLGTQQVNREVKYVTMNIVSDRDSFVWKGHDHLNLRTVPINMAPGFQATSVMQILPPAAITWVSLQSEWGLLAAGTAHGLALFDYKRNVAVMHRCTLNPNDLTGAGDTPISRRKSFKKSLRESFRRLRKGRSQRRANPTADADAKKEAPKKPTQESGDSFNPLEAKPVERQVEARPVDDSNGSMVRCLHFARTFLINVQNTVPTLWAGTNNGTVYVFTITIPSAAKRMEDAVTCQLAKEIQLKHRAPVIGITVLDGASVPLPEPLEVERGVSPLPDSTQPHRVIIASEEQFKIFSLPSLKPYCKYKLTAHEGSRVRRMGFAHFSCFVTEGTRTVKHTECCLVCLTNLGDCLVLSVPDLRRQLNAAAVRKEDINGISSLTFSKFGEALYLHSSSELQRITLSAHKVTKARCYLPLPPWARPIDPPATPGSREEGLHNGDHKSGDENGLGDEQHNVTMSSQSIGDITVDSVKDHLIAAVRSGANSPEQMAAKIGTINLQTSSVNQSSVIVKTTTLTTLNNSGTGTTEAGTTTTSHHSASTTTDNILEHSREEGQITRIETSTVTVPAGTDPKTILEMFERNRAPLTHPAPLAPTDDTETETETVTVTQPH